MKKGIFITATGTDIGKTYISALLVKQFKEIGLNCGYYKPVLSGAIVRNGQVVAGDAEYVTNIANLGGDSMERVSYAYRPVVSPHLAAEIEGRPISLEKIIDDYRKITELNEFTVVEGAGGIICPLNPVENLFMYNLPKALNLNTVVVADVVLVTINATFLTFDSMKRFV